MRLKVYIRCFILLIGCGSSLVLHSQQISIKSDRSDYQIYDEVIVTLTGELSDFTQYATLPTIPGLTLTGVDQSFDNAASGKKVKISQIFRYVANQSGDYEIGPAVIYSGTKRYFSNTISIHVGQDSRYETEGLAFIKTEVPSRKFYVGERIPVVTRLYYRSGYSADVSAIYAAEYKGFWHPDVTTYFNTAAQDSIVTIKGKQYFTRRVAVDYIYPNASGKLYIPEYSATVNLTEKSSDYDAYTTSIDISTLKSEIIATDLPPHDSLPGYNGDVGELNFNVSLNDSVTEEWNPIRMRVTITGKTNFSMMIPPQFNLPAGFRLEFVKSYDSLSFENIESASKIFEYQLIAEREGRYKLDGLSYSYFHPASKDYVTLRSDTLSLTVTPGTKIDSDSESNLPETFLSAKSALPEIMIVLFSIIGFCAALIFIGFRIKKSRTLKRAKEEAASKISQETEVTVPADNSDQEARAMLHSALLMLRNGQCALSIDSAYKSLLIRICAVARLKPHEASPHNVKYKLQKKFSKTSEVEEIIAHMEDIKLRRYSIKGSEFQLAEELINRTGRILDLLK
jgi:hypothetical protein